MADREGQVFPQIVKNFMVKALKIECGKFQEVCLGFCSRLLHKRMNKMMHNVASKYRMKIRLKSEWQPRGTFFLGRVPAPTPT